MVVMVMVMVMVMVVMMMMVCQSTYHIALEHMHSYLAYLLLDLPADAVTGSASPPLFSLLPHDPVDRMRN